ncbi:MAG: oligosaccharide flippase family protein [Methanomassiliicoccus sp.]|nr:oligosaccharide flippase family protein [Methanomassiliicoccus sp.]
MFEKFARFINAEGMAGPAFIMLVATVVGGGCNFLYQVMMANLIPLDLAELNTLLAILYIVTVPSSAVQNVIIRYVSKYNALGEDNIVAWLMKRILKFTSIAGVALSIIVTVVLLVPGVGETFAISSNLLIFLLAIGVFISLVSPVGQGTLQALQRFTAFGTMTVGNFVLKLTLGVGMVVLGLGVAGALGGVIIGIAFSTAISFFLVRRYFFIKPKVVEAKEIWRFTVPATVAILGFTILTQVDVIIATALLPLDQASYYAAASSLAKIILFLPGAVSTVMFPKISKAHAEKGETHRILKTSFAMTLALSGAVVAVYLLLPDFVLNILLPANPYKELIAPILQGLGGAMMLLGLANLFMLYGLATDGHAYITIIGLSVVVLLSLVGAVVALGIIFTPMILVEIMFVTGLFIIVLSGIYLLLIEREWRPRLLNGQ